MMIRELVDHKRKKDKDKEKVNSNLVEHIGHHVAQEGKKMDVLGHGYALSYDNCCNCLFVACIVDKVTYLL